MELPMFYDTVEEWNQALLLYDSALKEVGTKLDILSNEFKLTHQYNPIEHITSRIKSSQSIAKKMQHKGLELTTENIVKYLNDVAGIRIICSFTSDIYRIASLIAKQSDVKVLKVKDYIMCPKSNGYMSYHMIVSVPIFLSENVIDTKVEIQIRTIAMDFWASLEHKIYYKYEGNAPERIRNQLKECADIVSYLDKKMLSINEEVQSFNHVNEAQVRTYQSNLNDLFGRIVNEAEEVQEVKVEPELPKETLESALTANLIDDDNQEEEVMDGIISEQPKEKKDGFTGFFFRKKDKDVKQSAASE